MPPSSCIWVKMGGTGHDDVSKLAATPSGSILRNVFEQSAARDVRNAVDQSEYRLQQAEIGRVRPEQRVSEGLPKLGPVLGEWRRVGVQSVHVPDEGVAVGVQAVGRDTYQRVSDADAGGVDHRSALDHSEHEAGHIEVVSGEDAGHLSGLAAYERAADLLARARHPLDQRQDHVGAKGCSC